MVAGCVAWIWGEANAWRLDVPRRLGPLGPPPFLPVTVPWNSSGAIRGGVDIRGALESVGTWTPSVNNGPRPFSPGVVCIDGREGTMGGTSIFGS